ncbi:BLUF-domain-containing protein [Microstroma glucosiphilum]|uniref:BLUF-domain-containing protein n=1 Tax=Pseudomicrostroma glucosiphilum TaxID=1684307 RepID=A0A316U0Y5_9BASI|nr:BLUF-domain-containing protein [Pseudomicrostroma glucosiphilum]PWN19056.1 BLUF-domain-containing protein [Pseudomicrostroma glucosiphilum]
MATVNTLRPGGGDAHNHHARGASSSHTSPPVSPSVTTANLHHYPMPSSTFRQGPSERVKRALALEEAQRSGSASGTGSAMRPTKSDTGLDPTSLDVDMDTRRPSVPALFTRLSSEPSSPSSERGSSGKTTPSMASMTSTSSSATTATATTSSSSSGNDDEEALAEGEDPLIQLVYTSSAKIRYLPRSELEGILASSRKTNARNDITGLLMYRDGSFAQFLEGPRSAVLDTFARIRADRRHRGVIVVLKRPVEKRDFAEWRMGFRDMDAELPAGGNTNEHKGEVGKSALEQEGRDAVLDLASVNVADLSHAEMSRAIRTLIKVFHQSLARPA